MIGPHSLQNFYLPTKQMKVTRAFYEDVVGLKPRYADAERWIQYSIGDQNFALAAPVEMPEGAKGGVPVFKVGDIQAAITLLESAGFTCSRRSMGSHGTVASVLDPAGNVIQFFQK